MVRAWLVCLILLRFSGDLSGSTTTNSWTTLIQKRGPHAILSKIRHNNRHYWVKRPDPQKFTRTHLYWVKFLQTIIPLPILRPHAIDTPALLIKNEVARSQLFQAKGIATPRIVHHTDTFVVMKDLGDNSETLLKRTPNLAHRMKILTHVIEALLDLHQKGLHHGRPLLKDLIYHSQGTPSNAVRAGVYFLDLAESQCAHLSSTQAHARDIITIAYAALPFLNNSTEHFRTIMRVYTPPKKAEILAHIRHTMTLLHPFKVIISPFAHALGKDTLRAVNAHTALTQLVQNTPSVT